MTMDQPQSRPRRGRPPTKPTQALATRIRNTLLVFGGEAHRRDVIQAMARDMGVDVRNIPPELESAVILSFEEIWRNEEMRATYGFHLRFGEGSHRWALQMPELVDACASARRRAS
jgi:hypothetical protein